MELNDKIEVLEAMEEHKMKSYHDYMSLGLTEDAENEILEAIVIGRCIRILVDDDYASKVAKIYDVTL